MIEEGNAKIFTFNEIDYTGPGKKTVGFYNPTWKIDRDLQVLFCKYAYENGARKFLDGMASTGIRGIRIKKGLPDADVHINDVNKESFRLILKNVEANGIEATVTNENICTLLSKNKYDYIDIDPYGTPAPYIPYIFMGVKRKAFISISATDTATLCGVFKNTCIRRYGAVPSRNHGSKEIGIRILLGYIARIAMMHDFAFYPKISYAHSHYFRIYGYIEKGAKKADDCSENIGWFYWNNGWKKREFLSPPQKNFCGPLWTGKIHDNETIKEVMENADKKLQKMLKLFIEENEISLPYYETGRIAKEAGKKQPPISKLIEKLSPHGATRTHFAGDGIKTMADYEKIKALF